MTYSDIKEQLLNHSTYHFYVFVGDEIEVQRVYTERIANDKGQVIKRVDTVAEAIKAKSGGLLGNSVCYVCRDDLDFQKNEKLWENIEQLLKENTLIYIATKLDKRSKFYNAFNGQVFNNRLVVFEHMTEQVLIKHIKEHLNLSTSNCKELIRVCEGDYGRILMELDKVASYFDAMECDKPITGVTSDTISFMTTDEAFEKLMKDGAIYQPPSDAIFKWVDTVLSGKPRQSFKLLQECQELGEPTLRLLLVLYQGVRRLLQVQSCQSSNIAETTGLLQWEINKARECVGIYNTVELVESLRQIKAIETGIKTGSIDEEYAIPYAMVSLLGE